MPGSLNVVSMRTTIYIYYSRIFLRFVKILRHIIQLQCACNDTGYGIDALRIEGNTLTITTLGDAKEYCVKTTRTTPDDNNLCWKTIENNIASIQIYSYEQYYIWIKDTSGNISSPMSIDSNKEE